MMSRRQFLVSSAALAIAFPAVGRKRVDALPAVGLIADAQYADQKEKGTRYYRNSLKKLGEAVEEFNRLPLAGVVNLGDLIDREADNFAPALAALKRSAHSFYQVLGNHDYAVADDVKARVPRLLGLRRRYYLWNLGKWCLVVLDTNEVSTYSHPDGAKEQKQAVAELARMQAASAKNAQTWNGRPGDEQLRWFEKVCRKADRTGRRVIVFAHHPVFPGNEHNVWNDAEVLRVVERNPNVVAWINGHNHAGLYGEYAGVPFLTMKGMVETADQNAFAVARLYEDRLELTGHGREPSREMLFRK